MRGEQVIDKLKHTSHHFVEMMPKHYWETTEKNIKGLIVNFYLKFSFKKAFCLFVFLF